MSCSPRSAKRWFALLGCLPGLASCLGTLDEVAGDDAPGGNGQSLPGAGGGTNRPRGNAPPSPDTGLWRLTRTEYNNTIRDLLGDASQPGNVLPPDRTFNGFDNNATGLTTDIDAAGNYDRVATAVVERALRPGSAARADLVTCDLAAGGRPCARSVIAAFVRRAWRRPVANDEVDRLVTALDVAAAQNDGIEAGVKLAFRMALVSPNFLYRAEIDPAGTKGLHPVSPHELATRLSYFLWSSTPDGALLDRADDGSLGRPEIFAAEVARMLGDPRADALVSNFAAQWLDARTLATVMPDTKVFRSFNEDVRQAMIAESQLFFREFLTGQRNLADMLDADFTFLNARLAGYYAVPGVTGTQMRQVMLSGDRRFGLLSQGGLLTLTSNANRTNIPKRGKWLLSRLLCTPPGDPPPDVPSLADATKEAGLPTAATAQKVWQAIEKRPECGRCHAAIDPYGLALEHYDGAGFWRDSYAGGGPIEAAGELALSDGSKAAFDGARALGRLLKKDARFVRCFAKTVFAYALGRDPRADGDQAAIDDLAVDLVQREGRIEDLIGLVASSQAFQLRGGQP